MRRGQRSRLRTDSLCQLEDVKRVQDMGQQRLALVSPQRRPAVERGTDSTPCHRYVVIG